MSFSTPLPPPSSSATPKPMGNCKQVAVGVLQKSNGELLLAQRPSGTSHAGWWEFPGGKFETGESLGDTLVRELQEELDITVTAWRPWFVKRHTYPHTTVQLHFCRVLAWQGDPRGREGQRIRWISLHETPPAPVLPATLPALKWLQLPLHYGISQAAEIGIDNFLEKFNLALRQGLRWLQCREPGLSEADAQHFFEQLLMTRDRFNASLAVDAANKRCNDPCKIIINGIHPTSWWARADGVHLPAAQAHQLTRRPAVEWLGVSTHDAADIKQARQLEADWIVLGSVKPTLSHPERPALGWADFELLATTAGQPVYAIGGLAHPDLSTAQQHGAHGIALMRHLADSTDEGNPVNF